MKPWPVDRSERRDIGSLVPYARNARTHSPAQVQQIAASMKEWGWTNPVLIDDDGGIISGHGRVLAAQALGLGEVPVMIATGWTEAQKRAYVIADNKLALNADWDTDILAVELDELRDLEFDIKLTGFASGDLNEMIGTPNTGSANEAPFNYQEHFAVLVDCQDEATQRATYDKLVALGYTCKVLVN